MTKKITDPKDSDLFRQAVGKVHAVKSDKIQVKPSNLRPYPKPQAYDPNEDWLGELELDNVRPEETLSFTAPGIQHSVSAKLRKGFFGVQAELDLHGLNGEEAKRLLSQFLHDSVTRGYRCIHIIHGKGYRSTDNQPVLKNNINRWLRQHKDVQAFCSASPRQGGAGAVYVLLRLSKDHPEKYGE